MNTLPKTSLKPLYSQLHGRSGIACIKVAQQTYQDQKIKEENSFSGHLTEEVTVPVSIETQFLFKGELEHKVYQQMP